MMHVVLFIVYFIILCWLMTRMRFFNSQLKPGALLLFFALHVAAGCAHTWIAYRFFPNHGDTWFFFNESIAMKAELIKQPEKFFERMFAAGNFNFTDTSKPLLDVQYQALQYVNVFLNFLSSDNFYINTLLFSFPVFAGSIALFNVFTRFYESILPACCSLLLPSILFWTSVVYKDGIFYLAIGFFFYYLLGAGKSTTTRLVIALICIALMAASRANALISLAPAIVLFWLTEKQKWTKIKSVAVIAAAGAIMAIALNFIIPGGVLHGISERQRDFQSLSGGSKIYLPLLDASPGSFIQAFPVAVLNGFFQPVPGAGGKFIYNAFTAELVVIWVMIAVASWLLLTKKSSKLTNFDYCCLVFALPGLIIIGYIVPFVGAIIRYRSIYLPFLLAPFLQTICNYPLPVVARLNNWLSKNILAVTAT